jgi:sugar/nucleoside kinase (ribokinase family)
MFACPRNARLVGIFGWSYVTVIADLASPAKTPLPAISICTIRASTAWNTSWRRRDRGGLDGQAASARAAGRDSADFVNERTMNVLVIGTIGFDCIGATHEMLRDDSQTVPLDSLARSHGGRGANFAVFAHALGCDVRLIAAVGEDFRSSSYRAELEEKEIDLTGLFWNQSRESPRVFIVTSGDDSRVYVFRDRRENSDSDFCQWTIQMVNLDRCDAIYCTSEVPQANAEALLTSKSSIKVFAPGHDLHLYDRQCLRTCLESAKIVLVNSVEMQQLKSLIGEDISSSRSPLLRNLVALVITYGGMGSVVHSATGSFRVPPPLATQVVDTTGAGDAYAAGFVAEMVTSGDLLQAARTGNVVASFAVTSPGSQTAVPSPEDVALRRAEFYGQ